MIYLDKTDILNEIRTKFITVLKNQQFFNLSLEKIKQIANEFKPETEFEYNLTSSNFDKLNKAILKEVFIAASSRLELIFPPDKLNSSIILFILLFLAKSSKEEIKTEKSNLIRLLINNTRDKRDSSKFSSGRLSFLIVNLIYFMIYVIIYFLLSIVILQVFGKLNLREIEMLLVDRIEVKRISPDKLQEYFISKFEMINPKMKSPEPILNCCLPYIFEPIKDLIQIHSESESVEIPNGDIDEIINRIVFLQNPLEFLEVILTMKIKDY